MKVLLIGNYAPDRQESMQRYAALMDEGLRAAGHDVTLALPRQTLNPAGRAPQGLWKWVGYADKLLLSPPALRRAASAADVVHVCDHSNAIYVPPRRSRPYVVTCHDLLAVRGALGEDTDCPASATGRHLQRMVVRGLARADAIACDSTATLEDVQRLVAGYRGGLAMIPPSLNHPFGRRREEEIAPILAQVPRLDRSRPYLLMVGSNLPRKNRDGALRILAQVAGDWPGDLVFAGQPLNEALRALAARLGVADRVVEAAKPGNALLEALYNGAQALLFPSRHEGFGWPITEAQACGCPVICADRPPQPEVAGGAALICSTEDEASFARAIRAIAADAALRADLIERGLRNIERYRPESMVAQVLALYRGLV
jgi:glycosyltransferase involved in cell wall biosynthesis